MLHIGLHLSLQDGADGILKQIIELQIDSFQVFLDSPLTWTTHRDLFKLQSMVERARRDFGVSTVFIHSPYLVHLGSKVATVRSKSWHRIRDDLLAAEELNADGYVVHFDLQSQEDVKEFSEEYARHLATLPSRVPLLLENVAKAGAVGAHLPSLLNIAEILNEMYPVALCVDTAHLAAAGWDLAKLTDEEQWCRIANYTSLVHFNDLKAAVGSSRDIHTHLGKGTIGHGKLKTFVRALSEGTSVILETPKDSPEADKENISVLKRMLE